MANLERILKRRRDVDEAELDDLRHLVLARLAATNGHAANGHAANGHAANGHAANDSPASDRSPVVVRRISGGMPDGGLHAVVGAEPRAPSAWLLVAPLDDPGADTAATDPWTAPPMFQAEVPAQAEVDSLYEALAAQEALREARRDEALIAPEALPIASDVVPIASDVVPIAPDALPIAVEPQYEVVDAAEPEVRPQPRPKQRPSRAAAKEPRRAEPRSEMTPVASTDPVRGEPTACCPSCAVLLERPPAKDARCPRCHQRIIVRSVGARVAILAEAVLPFFEAERHNEARWTNDRRRWLELAREGGAGGDPGPALAGELISEDDVAVARARYMSGVDRAFRVAEKDRRWEEAARIRYEQAGAMSAIAGSSDAPSDEVVNLHRDGIAADLRAIGEVAKNAEIRGEGCCDACQADDHRVAQIAEELRSPTLPHEGCPDGLCRCRWFLTTRDQELLAALLRRQMGADRRTAELPDDPRDAMSAIA